MLRDRKADFDFTFNWGNCSVLLQKFVATMFLNWLGVIDKTAAN